MGEIVVLRGYSIMKKYSFKNWLPLAIGVMSAAMALPQLQAQGPISYQYFYDSAGKLIRVVDSTGASVQYSYDPAHNLIGITQSSVPAGLSILNFLPNQGGPGTTVTVQGQGFNATPSNNTVKFNGATATVLAATSTSLTVNVPDTATTGPITVTVGGNTAASTANFTALAIPLLSATAPKAILANQTGLTINVTGLNLSGATFAFLPVGNPAVITITNTLTSANSATLTVNTGQPSFEPGAGRQQRLRKFHLVRQCDQRRRGPSSECRFRRRRPDQRAGTRPQYGSGQSRQRWRRHAGRLGISIRAQPGRCYGCSQTVGGQRRPHQPSGVSGWHRPHQFQPDCRRMSRP